MKGSEPPDDESTVEAEEARAAKIEKQVGRRKGPGNKLQRTELRARALIQWRIVNISARYEDMLAWAGAEFGIGRSAAAEIAAYADTILAEQWREGDPKDAEMIGQKLLALAEEAARAGKYNAAGLQLERYMRLKGLGVPDRMTVTVTQTLTDEMAELDDAELEIAAKIARRREERIANAGADAAQPNPETEH